MCAHVLEKFGGLIFVRSDGLRLRERDKDLYMVNNLLREHSKCTDLSQM